MRSLSSLLVLTLLLGATAACADSQGSAATCKVFDGTMYVDKPTGAPPGLHSIKLAYEGDLWNQQDRGSQLPVRENVESQARAAQAGGMPLVLDIERWHVDSTVPDAEFAEHVARLKTVVAWAKSAAPQVQVGFFSLAPMPAVAWALAPAGSDNYAAWRHANDRLQQLASSVDVIFPHAYTYRNDPEEWQAYAIRNIEEARRYGKPVYLFLWPQYTERNKELGYQFLPVEFWRLQLRTACAHADGIVIWGGWDPALGRRAPWNDSAGWWREVLSMLTRPAG